MPFRRIQSVLLAVSVVAVSVVATGCYDRQELEQQAFVLAIGIDKAPGELIDCSFQLALPTSPSSGGSDSGGKKPLASRGPITVRAHTVMEAVLLANANVERRLTFTHLKMVAFGDSLAKAGVAEQIRPLIRYREFRRTVMLTICKGQAGDVLRQLNPVIERSPTRIAEDMLSVGQHYGFIPVQAYLQDFVRSMSNPHESSVLPMCAVNESASSNSKGKAPLRGSNVSFAAGETVRSGGNPVEWIGGAVFRKDQLTETINGRQVLYLRLLRGDITRAMVDLPDPLHPAKQITLSVHRAREPRYKITLAGPVRVQVDIPLEADLVNVESGQNYADATQRQVLEQRLGHTMDGETETLLKLLYNKRQLDAIPLSNYLRLQFPTHQAYVRYPLERKLATAQFHTHVVIHLRRFGIQTEPLVPLL